MLSDDLPHFHRSRYISAGRVHDYGQLPVADTGQKLTQIARGFRIDHALGGNPVGASLGSTVAGAGIGVNEHELHGCARYLSCCDRRKDKERQSRHGCQPAGLDKEARNMQENHWNHKATPPRICVMDGH
ncbi:hypothetical protein HGP17_21540 [Rhizobium sp. P38BS-XIX]|uniref:hypothetical protein n=1 Tax=Rhizobium sp. P38BS-XIX TaxID=2726740 RepID=UPI00145736B0|nr:hypothetical protein [Rhizobium sp. P38BS-XIX]NLR99413.1 hypothetical protein [Rhizobium sp. P38BS-XIX]